MRFNPDVLPAEFRAIDKLPSPARIGERLLQEIHVSIFGRVRMTYAAVVPNGRLGEAFWILEYAELVG